MLIKRIQFKRSLVQAALVLASSTLAFSILVVPKQVNADTTTQNNAPNTLTSSNYDDTSVANIYNQDNYYSQSNFDGKNSISTDYAIKSMRNGTFNQSRFDYLKQQENNQKQKYYKVNNARIKNLMQGKKLYKKALTSKKYNNYEYTKKELKNKIKIYDEQIKYLKAHINEFIPHNSYY